MAEFDSLPINHDDFRKIKGIGEVTALALYELGIRTYEELARSTSAHLVALLKGKIPDLSLRRIEKEDWPTQARTLLEENIRLANETQNLPPHKGVWQELADFFVSFGYVADAEGQEHLQTKVHHSQADKFGQWDGIATERLVAWMLMQANLPEPTQGEASHAENAISNNKISQPDSEKFVRIVLSDVWVDEVEAPDDAMQTQTGNLLRIESQLTLPEAELLDERLVHAPYSVELYLIDMHANQSKLVNAYSNQLIPGKYNYHIIQNIDIPEAGQYQIFILARLLPPSIGIAQAQGPLIRVEA